MTPLLAEIRALTPTIRACADDIERLRRLPDDLVARLAELGVFRLAVPQAAGGLQADPLDLVDVVEELGFADGSAGWVAMIAAATGIVLGRLSREVAADMAATPGFLIAGVAAPGGRAVSSGAGYRVTGRWPFASGCAHATHLVGGVIVDGGEVGAPPDVRIAVMRSDELAVHDTWHVSGLKGTGSHDIAAADVFLPTDRLVSLLHPPVDDADLYRFPALGFLALGIGAVALGIARQAIGAFAELAAGKRAPATGRLLRDKPSAQAAMAGAEALRASGLALPRDEIASTVTAVSAGAVSTEHRARLRLAILTATRNAASAVDLVYDAGGASSVRESSVLQRCFRDIHVATQHAMVGPDVAESIGLVLLDRAQIAPRL